LVKGSFIEIASIFTLIYPVYITVKIEFPVAKQQGYFFAKKQIAKFHKIGSCVLISKNVK